MNQSLILTVAATFLHDFFTAIWIGGMFILVLVVMPSARSTLDGSPLLRKFVVMAEARMRRLALISMVALGITGIALKRFNGTEGGLFDFSTAYGSVLAAKHLASMLMVAVAILRTRLANKAAGNKAASGKTSARLLMANLCLGVLVLILSATLASLA